MAAVDEKNVELDELEESVKLPKAVVKPKLNLSGVKELAEFKHRLGYLRLGSFGSALLHVLVTLIVMIMAFTRGTGAEYLSETLVVCAFGCLNTCVFAFVETWRTLAGTAAHTELPSWNWHNEGFLNSVGNIFCLCFASIPALVVFILHSLGHQFFHVLTSQRTTNPGVFGIIMFHLIAGSSVFIVDVATILSSTRSLKTFQRKEDEEEKDKEKKQEPKKKNEDDEDDDDESEADELRPVNPGDRTLALVTLLAHGCLTIDLIIIASRPPVNSGTFVPTVIFGCMFATWIYYTARNWSMEKVSESWLLNLRLITILHLFAVLCFWWMTLCVLLILSGNIGTGFFSSLQTIAENDGIRGLLLSVLVIFIFVSVAIYAVILYVHSRSMWSLDEIASLSLAAQLQAKLKEDRDQ